MSEPGQSDIQLPGLNQWSKGKYRDRFFRSRPWMQVLAIFLALLWVLGTVISYSQGTTDEDYDEDGVLDASGVAIMIAEQAESLTPIEQWLVDAGDVESLQHYSIQTLEQALAKDQLEESGVATLACLYWAKGDEKSCRKIIDQLPTDDFVSTGVLVDLLEGKQLDQEQWDNFEDEIRGWPRDWMILFLAEKAIATQGNNYPGSDDLNVLVSQRRQGFLVAQAQISIVVWAVFLAGLGSCLILFRKSRVGLLHLRADQRKRRTSRFADLWPLSLGVIVFVGGDFIADWQSSYLWTFLPDEVYGNGFRLISVLFDSYWRLFTVIVMLLVLFLRPGYMKRTFLKPVPHLIHWVMAACAITWLFDLALYNLPNEWFPIDPTVGHQWKEAGWWGLASGFISAVIMAPICEEIVFRGLLFNVLKNRLGLHAGAWISAVVFAAVHFYGFQDLIAVGFFGLVMAYVYRSTNSLLPCILCHALFNLIVTTWSWVLYLSPEELWKIG